MGMIFTKLVNILQWGFIPKENDQKHFGWVHPIFSFLFGTSIGLLIIVKMSKVIEKHFGTVKGNVPKWDRKYLSLFFYGYMIALLITRVSTNGKISFFYFFIFLYLLGPIAFYDLLWACNIAILMLGIGLQRNSPILIGGSLVTILVDQVY